MTNRALALGLALGLTAVGCQTVIPRDPFYTSSKEIDSALPEEGVYPRGRKLAFMGYSGEPARDLTNGFTVAGPVYGNQLPYLERCFQKGWPVVAQIGPHITFNDKAPAKYKVNEAELRREVEQQINELTGHKEIVWWAIQPEELRPWRKDEMTYLQIVCDAIRKNDSLARPIYIYNPNNRAVDTLLTIGRQVDVVGKGCYVNLAGHKRDRAWVRWSVEQAVQAVRGAGRTNAIPILIPELCADPDRSEDKEIRDWVRHDVYLGMVSGAKGVVIWSLFKRGEVRRTWKLWYDAYSECARELNGDRGLAQVFLFGEPRTDLQVQLVNGAATNTVQLGGNVEPDTTNPKESAPRKIPVNSWTSAEFVSGGSHWLFIVNSANSPAVFTVSGWPAGSRAENAFDGTMINQNGKQPLRMALSAYEVAAVRFIAARQ
jgi:hypothetical protein